MQDNFEPAPFLLEKNTLFLKQIGIILAVGLFYIGYVFVQPLHLIIDKVADPAVGGITVGYGHLSTLIYKYTDLDLGFVTRPLDQDFILRVRIATYVNQKNAASLLDIATDGKLSGEKREEALLALLEFESAQDWIQPVLNELPKGGVFGLYEEKAFAMDELMKRIREEGGIQAPLVRDYAEVAFSSLLRIPESIPRQHTFHWLPLAIPEEALFIIISRIGLETDPQVQKAIESALWDIRAISTPDRAIQQLTPLFQNPPWPEVKIPIAVLLSRLGHTQAYEFVKSSVSPDKYADVRQELVRLAHMKIPFPKFLAPSDRRVELARRKRARDLQQQLAMEKEQRRWAEEQAQLKLARAERAQEKQAKKAARTLTPSVSQPIVQAPVKKKEPPSKTALLPPVSSIAREKKEQAPEPPATSSFETESAEPTETAVASLPPDQPAPDLFPSKSQAKKPKSNMNYVDVIFEVKTQEVPLYQEPGQTVTGKLPVGSRGKADFEVIIGEDHWYQVKSKNGRGWANGALLTVYNLSPGEEAPYSPPTSTSEPSPDEASRNESTYFEPNMADVPVFKEPSDNSPQSGKLAEGKAYLAVKSEKVGADRWFLLQMPDGNTGWARGIDIQLANVKQPAQLELPTEPMSIRAQKSAFAAEWVVASVKGVPVYDRPSIAAGILKQISPPDVYKVAESFAGDGKEWYKIKLSAKTEGWVQALDVNLTKGNSP